MVTGLYWLGWQGEWPKSGWTGWGRGGGLCWSPGLLQPLPDRSGERVTNPNFVQSSWSTVKPLPPRLPLHSNTKAYVSSSVSCFIMMLPWFSDHVICQVTTKVRTNKTETHTVLMSVIKQYMCLQYFTWCCIRCSGRAVR